MIYGFGSADKFCANLTDILLSLLPLSIAERLKGFKDLPPTCFWCKI